MWVRKGNIMCNKCSENKMFYIDIMLTHNCNFSCTYCYECGEEKKQEEIVKISNENLNKIVSHVKKIINEDTNLNVVINFWGGEPTLACDKIDYVVEKLKKYKQVNFIVFTNGYDIKTLMKISRKVNFNRFNIQVSYDFSLQNKNRLCNSDKNSSNIVKSNLIFLLKNGYNVTCKSTISVKDLPSIYELYIDYIQFKKENDSNFALVLTVDTEYKYSSSSDTNKLLSDFESSLQAILLHKVTDIKDHDNSCGEYMFNWFSSDCNKVCNLGHDFICVDIDGSIYPCHGAVFSINKTDHVIGNINDDKFLNSIELPYYNGSMTLNDYNNECQKCFASVCFKCNIHNYDEVKSTSKLSYIENIYNFKKDINCDIYRLISKYQIALNRIINDMKEV